MNEKSVKPYIDKIVSSAIPEEKKLAITLTTVGLGVLLTTNNITGSIIGASKKIGISGSIVGWILIGIGLLLFYKKKISQKEKNKE